MENSAAPSGKKQVAFRDFAYPIHQFCRGLNLSSFRVLVFKVKPLWLHIFYFATLSLIGYLGLMVSKPKTTSLRPKNFDVFFTSVSASTDSSMSTVEMEVFSNAQLIIMTILMLLGGEVFISLLVLQLSKPRLPKTQSVDDRVGSNRINTLYSANPVDQIELNVVSCSYIENENSMISLANKSSSDDVLKNNCFRYLCYVVIGYLLVVHLVGSSLVDLYINLVPSAREVLENKGLQIKTFSVFTVVSTFSNCGFVPTNENMMVFKKNSGLLLLLIPQILLGNTLYPLCLRFVIWVLNKINKRVEFDYLLKNSREIGYSHLLSSSHTCFLAITASGFIVLQFVLFCALEWKSEAMEGLSSYEKVVGSLFQVINSRHSGESVFDISIISPAISVLFLVMMYLPPYTSFLPARKRDSSNCKQRENEEQRFWESLIFSPLTYLVIFIILVCITERQMMKEDPLNFNVLNIAIEVISAYGNVGFSTGYNCKRQLKPKNSCKSPYYGLVGRWSNQGKFILILVMYYGRLKKFNLNGGKAWKLL